MFFVLCFLFFAVFLHCPLLCPLYVMLFLLLATQHVDKQGLNWILICRFCLFLDYLKRNSAAWCGLTGWMQTQIHAIFFPQNHVEMQVAVFQQISSLPSMSPSEVRRQGGPFQNPPDFAQI
jgi:hypothetical protein